jgi:hypothetical protein
VLGLFLRNYDLVFPYCPVTGKGGEREHFIPSGFQLRHVRRSALHRWNSGRRIEVLLGGLARVLYDAIVARSSTNGILREAPRFDEGVNSHEHGGLGVMVLSSQSTTCA